MTPLNDKYAYNIRKQQMSERKSRSILEELNSISVDRSRHHVLENRVEHLVSSAENIKVPMSHRSPEEALDLERRLINSINPGDSKKFHGIKKVVAENNNEV